MSSALQGSLWGFLLGDMKMRRDVPLNEKYTLSISESAAYFNIGIKKMRRLAEDHIGDFALQNGNRLLVIRTKFEEFLLTSSAI